MTDMIAFDKSLKFVCSAAANTAKASNAFALDSECVKADLFQQVNSTKNSSNAQKIKTQKAVLASLDWSTALLVQYKDFTVSFKQFTCLLKTFKFLYIMPHVYEILQ